MVRDIIPACRIVLLRTQWKPSAIAAEIRCSTSTEIDLGARLQRHWSLCALHVVPRGRYRRVHSAAKAALLEYQPQHSWAFQWFQAKSSSFLNLLDRNLTVVSHPRAYLETVAGIRCHEQSLI